MDNKKKFFNPSKSLNKQRDWIGNQKLLIKKKAQGQMASLVNPINCLENN